MSELFKKLEYMTLHCHIKGLYESQGMEDGPDSGTLIATRNASTPNNGIINMANFPTTEQHAPATPPKINGETALHQQSPQPPQDRPETDACHEDNVESPAKSAKSMDVDDVDMDGVEEEICDEEQLDDKGETKEAEEGNENQKSGEDDEENDSAEDGSSSGGDNLVIDEEVKPKRRNNAPILKPQDIQKPSVDIDKLVSVDVDEPSEQVHKTSVEQIDNPSDIKTNDAQDINSDPSQIPNENVQQKLGEQYIHSNPYFAESIFELSNHYNTTQVSEGIPKLSLKKVGNRYAKRVRGKNGKPKLREYAQYLGLQPTVQFKCSKCGSAGFESLQLLNEHLVNCTAIAPMHPPPPPANNSTNFKVTRKVFLCSACGTYYENWNLFLHMREVHKRFICLYCLGMFPHAEKLAGHLVHKHNCTPAKHLDELEFAGAHREPCFLMCCDCQMVFTEQDCVTLHKCIGDTSKVGDKVSGGGQDVQVTTNQLVIETSATKDGELSVTGTVEVGSTPEGEIDKTTQGDLVSDKDIKVETSGDIEQGEECIENKAKSENNSDLDTTLPIEGRDHSEDDVGEQDENDEDEETNENGPEDESMHVDDGPNTEMAVDDDSADEEEKLEDEEMADVDLDTTRKVPKVTLKFARMYPSGEEEAGPTAGDKSQADLSDHSEQEQSENEAGDQSDDSEKNTTESNSQTTLTTQDTQHESSEVDVEGTSSQEENQNILDESFENLSQETITTSEKRSAEEESDIPMSQEDDESERSQDDELVKSQELSQEEQDLDIREEISSIPTAGSEIAINEIELDQPLDKFNIKLLLRKCLQATIPTCLYCNHARKIAVNGKQLGLHAISDHRYSSIVKSITAEELIPESFNNRIQDSLEELDKMYFSLEDDKVEGSMNYIHEFECFQCRYSSMAHKELYMHNRKLHAKALLLCTMCKTSFYSYSELLCHLCPGVYSSDRDRDIYFRCCMCVSDDMPSAFRLVVHMRRKHHVCDVCLEFCYNQMRLSNHVWKHKLHHLCYRCGIAYRNKPDITKHLFWKHGTESVECKKCLQKKWPHVYHFCQPPGSFPCDECSETMSRASKLKVHKRLHSKEFPYACSEVDCTAAFISKKLLAKHKKKVHRDPEEPEKIEEEETIMDVVIEDIKEEYKVEESLTSMKEEEEKPKPKVDVYDLPELNLSESDSDSEDESTKSTSIFKPENDLSSSILVNTDDFILDNSQDTILKLADELGLESDLSADVKAVPSPEMENTVLDIWNNFKNYQENIGKTLNTDSTKDDDFPKILTDIPPVITLEEALRDHDYCPRTTDTLIEQEGIPGLLEHLTVNKSPTKSADHDYCTGGDIVKDESGENDKLLTSMEIIGVDGLIKSEKGKADKDSSDSGSDSDSSSCTCGSDCSCSSGSSSSSSDSSESDSSSEEGRRKQQVRREKRKGKKPKPGSVVPCIVAEANENEGIFGDEAKPSSQSPNSTKPTQILAIKDEPIGDSDLSTSESDTDEEFYDKEPQKIANKLLAEKREKLQMAAMGAFLNGSLLDGRPTTPSLPEEAVPLHKKEKESKKSKKSKSKKKKKKKRESKMSETPMTYIHRKHSQIAPLTLTLPKSAPSTPMYHSPLNNSNHIPMGMSNLTLVSQGAILTDNENSATRASKRRRVPNKFYGYSSDEENEKIAATGAPHIKFRKVDLPSPKPPLVPPLTIKTPKPQQVVNPISIKMSANPDEMRVQPLRLPFPKQRRRAPSKPKGRKGHLTQSTPTLRHSLPQNYPQSHQIRRPVILPPRPSEFPIRANDDSGTDSNSSTSDADEEPIPTPAARIHTGPPPGLHPGGKPNVSNTTSLYCYCRCPYDEVSEMIGCDSDECAIEWFHFECVGIMVPPKGQWFCPDCRKKKQQRREALNQTR